MERKATLQGYLTVSAVVGMSAGVECFLPWTKRTSKANGGHLGRPIMCVFPVQGKPGFAGVVDGDDDDD